MQAEEEMALANTDNSLVDYGQALNNAASFEQAMKMSTFLSKSLFIPKEFQNKPADCLIALQMAGNLGVSPFEVMKGIYIVHGKPAFSSQFAIGLANLRGPFESNISFETTGTGAEMTVYAEATLKKTGKKVKASFSMQQAIDAGWAGRNPNYKAIPEQMLSYKSAMMLIRKTCPEILMGMRTIEELSDHKPQHENEAIKTMQKKVEGSVK